MPKEGAEIPLVQGFYSSTSLPFQAQRCYNMEPVIAEAGGVESSLVASNPLDEACTINSDFFGGVVERPVLAVQKDQVSSPTFNTQWIVVTYDASDVTRFYLLVAGQAPVLIFTVPTVGATPVDIAYNGIHAVVLMDGLTNNTGYFITGAVVQAMNVYDPNFGTAIPDLKSVAFKDGYFFYCNQTQTYNSEPVTGASGGRAVSLLDVVLNNEHTDTNACVRVVGNYLMVLGTQYTEVFQITNNPSGFVGTRLKGSTLPVGMLDRFEDRSETTEYSNVFIKNTTHDGSLYFVGASLTGGKGIYRIGGLQYEKISTPVIDQFIDNCNFGGMYAYSVDGQSQIGVCLIDKPSYSTKSTVIPPAETDYPRQNPLYYGGAYTFAYSPEASAKLGYKYWFERGNGIYSSGGSTLHAAPSWILGNTGSNDSENTYIVGFMQDSIGSISGLFEVVNRQDELFIDRQVGLPVPPQVGDGIAGWPKAVTAANIPNDINPILHRTVRVIADPNYGEPVDTNLVPNNQLYLWYSTDGGYTFPLSNRRDAALRTERFGYTEYRRLGQSRYGRIYLLTNTSTAFFGSEPRVDRWGRLYLVG